jgi:mannose-1-phosphate guanylyltransferase
MTNIILCGGNGTRLWPISRTLMPKQFIKLFNKKSLFQLTIKRNKELSDNFIIVLNNKQYFLSVDQLEELNYSVNPKFILEPIAKNTAPAIAFAAFSVDPEEILLISPSDHLIDDTMLYKKSINKALKLAQQNKLVTFGITPTHAETGFGYIKADGNKVLGFYEKPNLEAAKEYLKAGNFYWNSGMFMFKAKIYLEELKKHAPQIYKTTKKAYMNTKQDNCIEFEVNDVKEIPEESIDYAVMEKSNKVAVVASNFKWNDLGSFDALYDVLPKDENLNTKNKNLISNNARNNFVHTENRLIALLDVEDLIIVDTDDALLITKKGKSQKIKDIVNTLKSQNSHLPHTHVTVHRPWGTYTVLEEYDKYKIKTITVKPKKRLSLQRHLHRSEHWIVVSGTALVEIGDTKQTIYSNESVYIPIGEKHRLTNIGSIPLVIVEAQVGDYLGEDDIQRFDDDYRRV